MDLNYQYFKLRKNMGRQPLFCEFPAHLIDTIAPDRSEQKRYILRNPVNEEAQVGSTQSACEINTIRVQTTSSGMNHDEGGWPKDVNYLDEEAVSRYRRRIERDDGYVNAVLDLYPKFKHTIYQNNAIELYQMYFSGMPTENPVEKYVVTKKNKFKELNGLQRPVSCIDWTIEDDPKIVTTNCDKTFLLHGNPLNRKHDIYVWNMDNPCDPVETLEPPCQCWQVACSPAHPNVIVGGFQDGRVCIFDILESRHPTLISPPHLAHRDPVSALLYIHSRTNTEFFSGSTDGMCMWWDIRKLSQPTETMIMAVSVPPGETMDMRHAQPVTALQFDRAFPTRFLCGTDTGLVINVNRKGKTLSEIITSVYNAHYGPVKAVHRSPVTSKMFITCGDWRTHVWSDEVTGSPIIYGTSNRFRVNDVCWTPNRISSFMTIGDDGRVRCWDMLRNYKKPTVCHTISKEPLVKMKIHDSGQFMAIGDKKGAIYLVALSHDLTVSGENDKPVMVQTYERETKREYILANRIKEIQLKLRAKEEGTGEAEQVVEVNEDENIRLAEDAYRKMVNDELAGLGVKMLPKVVSKTTSGIRNR